MLGSDLFTIAAICVTSWFVNLSGVGVTLNTPNQAKAKVRKAAVHCSRRWRNCKYSLCQVLSY